jgi:hypothetical protein
MKKLFIGILLIIIMLLLMMPGTVLAENTFNEGVVTIDTAWDGTLQSTIEGLVGYTSVTDIKELQWTQGSDTKVKI